MEHSKHLRTGLPAGKPVALPSPGGFRFWLRHARPGEVLTYHLGFLLADRAYPVLSGSHKQPDPIGEAKAKAAAQDREDPEFALRAIAEVDEVAKAAWRAQQEGTVALVQRKLGPGYYAYLAQKRGGVEHAWKEVA